MKMSAYVKTYKVSTHSRPKAAEYFGRKQQNRRFVSTHSRPKAAAQAKHLVSCP